MKKLMTVFIAMFFVFSLFAGGDEPIFEKKFGGYSQQFSIEVLGYGKDGDTMIFDLKITLIKGKDGEFTISRRQNDGMRMVAEGGGVYTDNWLEFGSRDSSVGSAQLSQELEKGIPVKIRVKFTEVEEEDFLMLCIPIARYDKSVHQQTFQVYKIKKSEFMSEE